MGTFRQEKIAANPTLRRSARQCRLKFLQAEIPSELTS
jgi:hypothetical protein